MNSLDRLAEQHIQDAIQRGELDALTGMGRPLQLDDDSMVPPELRAAYRLLKNAGFLPPELALYKEIKAAEELLLHIDDPDARCRALARLQVLRTKLESARGHSVQLDEYYYTQLVEKLAHDNE